MTALTPLALAAGSAIAMTGIAAITAVLIIRSALSGTPATHRATIITAVAELIRALRGR